MRKPLVILLLSVAIACAPPQPKVAGAPPINTAETEIAPDAVAATLLVDVRSLDPTFVVDLRYATANNFTGAPLPGYLANRAYLRREAAAALARVQRDLRPLGLAIEIFDAYRPVRATQAMGGWTERVPRSALLHDGY